MSGQVKAIRVGVVMFAGLVASGCIPMQTVRGSSLKFLTSAGASLTVSRPGPGVAAVLEQSFTERGFPVVNRAQVGPNNLVLFFKGNRDRLNWQNRTAAEVNSVGAQVGSWFAVRIKDDGARSQVQFYGKPTVYGSEACAEGDHDLRDTGYACKDVVVRADWPGLGLVEGREETQVISAIITILDERLPSR